MFSFVIVFVTIMYLFCLSSLFRCVIFIIAVLFSDVFFVSQYCQCLSLFYCFCSLLLHIITLVSVTVYHYCFYHCCFYHYCCFHHMLICVCRWVKRDSYLPMGSQNLKAVAKVTEGERRGCGGGNH